MIRGKETFLAHAIIEMAREKTLPLHHSDLKQLEQYIRRYVTKRAKQERKEITREYLDELTADLLEYHKETLEGLALTARH